MGFFRFLGYLRLLGCLGLLAIGSVALLCDGLRHKHEATEAMAKYRQPTTMTCAEFAHRQPTSGWFRITGCTSSAIDAAFVVTKFEHDSDKDNEHTDADEVLVPVYAESDDSDGPSHLAVLSRDKGLCDIINDMDKAGFFETKPVDSSTSDSDSDKSGASPTPAPSKKDEAAETARLKAFVEQNAKRIFTTRTIEGMVKSVDDLSSDQKKDLDLGREHLALPFVLFEEGASPKSAASDASLESGVGAAGTIAMAVVFGFIALAAFGQKGGGNNGGNGGSGVAYTPPGGAFVGQNPAARTSPVVPTAPPVLAPPVQAPPPSSQR